MTFAEMKRLKAQYRKATLRVARLERIEPYTGAGNARTLLLADLDRERREVARLEALIREAAQ